MTQGDPEDKHKDVMKRYLGFLKMFGYDVTVIRALGCGMESDANVDEYIAQAA
jgi:hypothetical protein